MFKLFCQGLALLFISLVSTASLNAQAPLPARNAAEIQEMLKKLNVLGSVLYVAAHPDDENQRLITYFAKERGYRTAYLSLTRGDGGQNLIGNEKGSLLGMLRTQELLGARRIDGGEQMFSRAIDFGYSKTPEETLAIWDKDKVLADVVWAIRKFRPDVIITRFPGPEKGGGGHGHHTSSYMLAKEAFSLANDKNAFPEQLEHVQTWQPKRLLWNTWRPDAERAKIVSIDIGAYNPVLGRSYGEIASMARSMHKCQAFGAALLRGSRMEHMEFELGDEPENDLFDDINTTWSRINNGDQISKYLSKAYEEFNPRMPEKSVSTLIKAYQEMKGQEGYWIEVKRKEVLNAIAYCSGMWFEATSQSPIVAQGDSANITLEVLKRLDVPVELHNVVFKAQGKVIHDYSVKQFLDTNAEVWTSEEGSLQFPTDDIEVSQPYWLREAGQKGIFQVKEQALIGLPENLPAITAEFHFRIEGEDLAFSMPVVHRYVDRAVGELYRPFVVAPPVTVNIDKKVYLFSDLGAQTVPLLIKSFSKEAQTTIEFNVPEGWKVEPPTLSFDLEGVGAERNASIQVTPPAYQSVGPLQSKITVNGKTSSHAQLSIAYSHIPTQMIFNEASTNLVRVNLEKQGKRIGYIMGSGDEVPASLEEIGYEVEFLTEDNLSLERLQQFDAVISGIRAYNTNQRMPFHHTQLMEYVKQGGTYICQYNTTYGLLLPDLGPFPIKLSRDRVSVEEASMKFLAPDHPVLNTPNKITQADMENWVQERGLYFPSEWSEEYTAIFEANDPGETPKQGSLLVAEYGDGYFVYTGLSFFRELPAGVPGAYRLFANIVSLGKETK